VTISVLIVGFVAMDGELNWMEGVMLVGVYLMLAIAFFFCPPRRMWGATRNT
jgi:Ca2+:H+ antiporter